MAKEKIEVELEPTVNPSALTKLKNQLVATPITQGLSEHLAGHGEALANRFGLGGALNKAKSLSAGVDTGQLGAAAAAFGVVGIALAGATGAAKAFSSIMNDISGLVGVSSPALLKRFEDTWNDIYGVLGNRLEPLLELWTDELRLAGDVLQSILPSQAEFRALIDEYRPLLKDVKGILTDIAPVVKVVLVKTLREAKDALHLFVGALRLLINVAKSIPGASVILGKGPELSSSFGMAARGASIVSGEELSRQAIIGALQVGAGSPAEQTAKNTEEIAANTGGILSAINPIFGIIQTGGQILRRFN